MDANFRGYLFIVLCHSDDLSGFWAAAGGSYELCSGFVFDVCIINRIGSGGLDIWRGFEDYA